MRLIFSEFPADYSQYHFPYQVLGIKGYKDNLPQLYDNGWLPYRSKKDWFYLCRSTRMRLSKFTLSSENRRILNKTPDLTFTVQPAEQFQYTPQIQKLCKQFADQKFGKNIMPTAAIRQMFTNANTTHVFTFFTSAVTSPLPSPTRRGKAPSFDKEGEGGVRRDGGPPVGYVTAIIHDHFLHYAHPFYDLNYDNPDLGLGMITRAIQWAKDQHKQFAYLGTCYTDRALYKIQFSGFEFFNGFQWSTNLEELKYLIKRQKQGHLLQDPIYKEKYEPQFDEAGVRISLK